MNYEDLTPEQQEKVKAIETPEEMLAFAKEEGIELADELLDAVPSGVDWVNWICPDYCKTPEHGKTRCFTNQ